MKPMRVLLLSVVVAAAGGMAFADDALQIAGREVGRDGVLTPRIAEVVGGTEPTTTPILVIEGPRVEGSAYQIAGTVEYSDVQGDGYLEMGSTFAEGPEYFTRTLDPSGVLGKLSGTSSARPFALPIRLTADAPAPTRLELNVVLPGPGRVKLSDLHFSSGITLAAAPGAWWSPRAARKIAGAGGAAVVVAAATIAVLCAFGSSQRLAEALLSALFALSGAGFVAGGAGLATRQPREVWLPLLLMGLLAALLPISLRGQVRRRFARIQLPSPRAHD